MGADAGDSVEDPDPFSVELTLDAQRGVLVGDHPDLPAGAVRAAAPRRNRENLRRGRRLVTILKRASADIAGCVGLRQLELVRSEASLGRDDCPAPANCVESQLRHGISSTTGDRGQQRLWPVARSPAHQGERAEGRAALLSSPHSRLPTPNCFSSLVDILDVEAPEALDRHAFAPASKGEQRTARWQLDGDLDAARNGAVVR
jgi:hypothetical protein